MEVVKGVHFRAGAQRIQIEVRAVITGLLKSAFENDGIIDM